MNSTTYFNEHVAVIVGILDWYEEISLMTYNGWVKWWFHNHVLLFGYQLPGLSKWQHWPDRQYKQGAGRFWLSTILGRNEFYRRWWVARVSIVVGGREGLRVRVGLWSSGIQFWIKLSGSFFHVEQCNGTSGSCVGRPFAPLLEVSAPLLPIFSSTLVAVTNEILKKFAWCSSAWDEWWLTGNFHLLHAATQRW